MGLQRRSAGLGQHACSGEATAGACAARGRKMRWFGLLTGQLDCHQWKRRRTCALWYVARPRADFRTIMISSVLAGRKMVDARSFQDYGKARIGNANFIGRSEAHGIRCQDLWRGARLRVVERVRVSSYGSAIKCAAMAFICSVFSMQYITYILKFLNIYTMKDRKDIQADTRMTNFFRE